MTVVGYALLGLIFSVCAFLEVLVMLAFVLRPSISGARRWLSAGFVAFVLYFLVITWAPSVAILLLAQVLRAIGIGFVGYHGISYIQVLMPNKVGLAGDLILEHHECGLSVGGACRWRMGATIWVPIDVFGVRGVKRIRTIDALFANQTKKRPVAPVRKNRKNLTPRRQDAKIE